MGLECADHSYIGATFAAVESGRPLCRLLAAGGASLSADSTR